MNILKVKIPVGKDGLVKKKFLANPSGEKGVGCADGCIKIVLDDNMMYQIRSFKASPNHLNHDIIPVDISFCEQISSMTIILRSIYPRTYFSDFW